MVEILYINRYVYGFFFKKKPVAYNLKYYWILKKTVNTKKY